MKYLLVGLLLCFASLGQAEEKVEADSGFWEYTYPIFIASGDTFIVTMQDSFWMTGERPKTERKWHGWDVWGRLWFLRPEIKKEEK